MLVKILQTCFLFKNVSPILIGLVFPLRSGLKMSCRSRNLSRGQNLHVAEYLNNVCQLIVISSSISKEVVAFLNCYSLQLQAFNYSCEKIAVRHVKQKSDL